MYKEPKICASAGLGFCVSGTLNDFYYDVEVKLYTSLIFLLYGTGAQFRFKNTR